MECSGCETWVVREGYEGLVLGNTEQAHTPEPEVPAGGSYDGTPLRDNLRFGDGELLKDGDGDIDVDDPSQRSLKGRYIVRVGWDDVHGWMGEVRPLSTF